MEGLCFPFSCHTQTLYKCRCSLPEQLFKFGSQVVARYFSFMKRKTGQIVPRVFMVVRAWRGRGKSLGNPRYPKEIFVMHTLILQLSIRSKGRSQFRSLFPRNSEKLWSILLAWRQSTKEGWGLRDIAAPQQENPYDSLIIHTPSNNTYAFSFCLVLWLAQARQGTITLNS